MTYDELLSLIALTVGVCRDCGHIVELMDLGDSLLISIKIQKKGER